MPSIQNALIVFFKWAKAGDVKTRLRPPLSPEQAAELYRAFVLDSFEKFKQIKNLDVLGFAAGDLGRGGTLEQDVLQMNVSLFMQSGDGLGERMSRAFESAFHQGYQRVVIVGTDSPDLPTAYLNAAFEVLSSPRQTVCIGPTDDGGYYALGMNNFFPDVFLNVPYSSPETYRETLKQICGLPIFYAPLPRWYDIDDINDLRKLVKSSGFGELRRTKAAIEELKEKI